MLMNKKKSLKKKLFYNLMTFNILYVKIFHLNQYQINCYSSFKDFVSLQIFYNPSLWKMTTKYKEAKNIISTLKIVNDNAERGVKLMEEFNDKFTKQEEQKQYVLQVIF
uniref:Uncharacterized protein n=1 Tax=Sipha flava TaxID=143950 RepID=A0A2S2QSD7_9HEMI